MASGWTVQAGNPASIFGRVTYDLTGNGFSVDDVASSGIRVELYQDAGDQQFDPNTDTLIAFALSAPDGTYTFPVSADGLYFVRELVPTGWTRTAGPAFYTFDVLAGVVYQHSGPMIDTFDFPSPPVSYVISAVDPNPALKKQTVAGVLGGERDVLVEVAGTPNPISANGLIGASSGNGSFVFGSATIPGSRAILQYDAIDPDNPGPPAALINAAGLNANFSDGNLNDGIRILFRQLDAGAPGANQIAVNITLTSPGGSANYAGTISENPGGGAFVVFLPFTSFVPSGSFSLAQVTSAEFRLNDSSQEDVDFTVDFLDVVRRSPENFDFANQALPSCLEGCVYVDLNTNGVLSAGEPGIDGVTITLSGTNLLDQAVFRSLITSNGGAYAFCDLLPGTYQLVETQPIGYVDAEETVGAAGGVIGPDRITGILLPPNTNAPGYYFGERLSAELVLTKTGPLTVVVAGSSFSYTIQVDNQGPGFAPQTVITDNLPAWFTLTGSSVPVSTTGVDQIQIDLGTLPAGESRTVTLTGTVDCCLPPAMTNTASVISLAAETNFVNNQDQAVTTLQTDTTPPVITFCPPSLDLGCNPSAIPEPDPGAVQATDNCSTAQVSHLGDQTTQNGCRVTILRTYQAEDACGNTATCTQTLSYTADTTPPMLLGVPASTTVSCDNIPDPAVVTASDSCDTLPITVQFSTTTQPGNCPGNYTLIRSWSAMDACGNRSSASQTLTVIDTTPPVLNCPPGPFVMWADCGLPTATVTNLVPLASASDTCSSPVTITQAPLPGTPFTGTIQVTLTATDACGQSASCQVELRQPASLGNRIWVDENQNGRQDDGEPNLAGVTVQLLDAQTQVVDQQVTGADGLYAFCVAPGEYCIQVLPASLPAGYVLTQPGVGDPAGDSSADRVTGRTPKTVLGPGDQDITLDIGVYQTTCIGDTVWIDVTRDGRPDNDNLVTQGLAGVRVQLCAVNNGLETLVAETVTIGTPANQGFYEFKDFPPGDYCVKLVVSSLPSRYDEITTPTTYCFTLPPGGITLTNDFGVIDAPTSIRLESFTATPSADGVRLEWVTGSEWRNLGFLVYRSERINGARVRVTPSLIEGQGTGSGAAYAFTDATATPGRAFYWLEDIELGGRTEVHGPALAVLPEPAGPARLSAPPVDGLDTMVLRVHDGDVLTLRPGWNLLLRSATALPRCQVRSGPQAGDWLEGSAISIQGEQALYLSVEGAVEVQIIIP